MSMHPSTYRPLAPTDEQFEAMHELMEAASIYNDAIEAMVPEGADRTYILRKLREVAMWTNIALLRNADGSPRKY